MEKTPKDPSRSIIDISGPALEGGSRPPPPPPTLIHARCPNRTCRSPWALFGSAVVAVELAQPEVRTEFGSALVCAVCQTPYIVTPDGVEACSPHLGAKAAVERAQAPPPPDDPGPTPDDTRWPKRGRPSAGPVR